MYGSLTRKANALGFNLSYNESNYGVLHVVDASGTIVFTGTYGQVFYFLN